MIFKIILAFSLIIASTFSASLIETSSQISSLMTTAYQLKAKLEIQRLQHLSFLTRMIDQLEKVDLNLRRCQIEGMEEYESTKSLALPGPTGEEGPPGLQGEAGDVGHIGFKGQSGIDGLEGRLTNGSGFDVNIGPVRFDAMLNRNYLNDLRIPSVGRPDACGGFIRLDGVTRVPIPINSYLSTRDITCSWVVWSHSSSIRLKLDTHEQTRRSYQSEVVSYVQSSYSFTAIYTKSGEPVSIQSQFIVIILRVSPRAYYIPNVDYIHLEETKLGSGAIQTMLPLVKESSHADPSFNITYEERMPSYKTKYSMIIIGKHTCGEGSLKITVPGDECGQTSGEVDILRMEAKNNRNSYYSSDSNRLFTYTRFSLCSRDSRQLSTLPYTPFVAVVTIQDGHHWEQSNYERRINVNFLLECV